MEVRQGKTNAPKTLVSLYWDYQNVKLNLQQATLLLAFAKTKGRLICNKVYYNSHSKDQASVKNALAGLDFKYFDVPCPLKNSADNQLIADCIEDIDNNLSPHIVIIVSGDGDFAKLVRTLQKLDKKVIIFAQRGNVKQKLIDLVKDDFYFVEQLSQLVVDKTEPHPNSNQFQITYKDAIECLIEAIKTALSQGKHSRFPLINNLMRHSQRYPNYQGFSSICKDDGTMFLSFSKFINAAMADGKVRVQITGKVQELFLIEGDRLVA